MKKTDIIDKLAFIYVKDRKILMAQSFGKDIFYIPGGKRESGESDAIALAREVKEELNVDILPDTIKYYGTFKSQVHDKAEGIIVKMTCYTADFAGELKPGAEIANIAFHTYAQRDIVGPADQIIFNDLKKKNLID